MKRLSIARIGLGLLVIASLAGCTVSESLKKSFERGYNRGAHKAVLKPMAAFQRAVEKYAEDHDGKYPTKIDKSFNEYYDGKNPFSGDLGITSNGDITDVDAVRKGPRPKLAIGELQYSSLNDGKSYAIISGAQDGKALTVNPEGGEVLVLTETFKAPEPGHSDSGDDDKAATDEKAAGDTQNDESDDSAGSAESAGSAAASSSAAGK